ncbi:unnamed protein product [Bemisia tabaci]|uniref:Uncharacterized protein n=1 Tax=Bemisia tabaci TaxID=7038 RepID=A0AAI8UU63_BEMTA|nr:unnamed protein product [Bemisia tabaci]
MGEPAVRRLFAIAYPDDPKRQRRERAIIGETIRSRGNFEHNVSLRSTDADFFPARRGADSVGARSMPNFKVCENCRRWYRRRTFRRHVSRCLRLQPERREDELPTMERRPSQAGSTRQVPRGLVVHAGHVNSARRLEETLAPHLRPGPVTEAGLRDHVIVGMVDRFYEGHRQPHHRPAVSRRLRDAAALLLACRRADPGIRTMSDCLRPGAFPTVLEAARQMSGYDVDSGDVRVVGMPARLRCVLRECLSFRHAEVLQSRHVSEAERERVRTETGDYQILLSASWRDLLMTNARRAQAVRRIDNPPPLPDEEDVAAVLAAARNEEEVYSYALRLQPSVCDFDRLCRALIASLTVFNRRRAGEVARARLAQFRNRPNPDDIPPEALERLPHAERESIQRYRVFYVHGKRGRRVPVLLTARNVESIELLVRCRYTLGIVTEPSDGELLFPRNGQPGVPYDAARILRDLRSRLPLIRPTALTTLQLRQQLGTLTSIVGSEALTQQVSEFMGHDPSTHRRHYGYPVQVAERGTIGACLERMTRPREELPVATTSAAPSAPSTSVPGDAREVETVDSTTSIISVDLHSEEEVTTPVGSPVAPRSSGSGEVPPDSPPEPEWAPPVWHPREIPREPEASTSREPEASTSRETPRTPCPAPSSVQPSAASSFRRWTEQENAAIRRAFRLHLQAGKLPTFSECADAKKTEPILAGRSSKSLRSRINEALKGRVHLGP